VEDEGFLSDLYCSTRKDEVAGFGFDSDQQAAFLRMQYGAQTQHYRLHYPQADHRIILCDGRPIGRIYIDRAGAHLTLVDIALLPEFRRQGIGTALLRELKEEAARVGKAVRLHVLKTNPAARLYEQLGFTRIGEDGVYLEMEFRAGASPAP
jgi:ribosomal protein S18 acetylase RimI-like enzyme